MVKMDPVVHFEMPAKDKKRVSDFYSKVFGWNIVQTGPEMGNYLLAQTAETDQQGMVKTPGTSDAPRASLRLCPWPLFFYKHCLTTILFFLVLDISLNYRFIRSDGTNKISN